MRRNQLVPDPPELPKYNQIGIVQRYRSVILLIHLKASYDGLRKKEQGGFNQR
jgi:hypothetical protein